MQIKENFNDALTIIIPRHISRAEKINAELSNLNLKVAFYSKLDQMDENTDILIIDSYGESLKFYNISKYVFVGKFKNVSPDESRIMVQGDFYRYNAALKSSFRYEVLKYYERMNDETAVIKKQLVDSIPNAAKPASARQLLIVFSVILLAGFLFMSLTGTDVWAEGDGQGGPQRRRPVQGRTVVRHGQHGTGQHSCSVSTCGFQPRRVSVG